MILVTGGTGLVGAHLLYYLTLENDIVKAIYRTAESLKTVKKVFSYYTTEAEKQFSKIQWIQADITKTPSLEQAFTNVDYVYHCAALVSFDPNDYKAMRKINIEGTANIVNFCIAQDVKKLCYVSSVAAIENKPNNGLIDEQDDWNFEIQKSGYAITKYGAELEVWRGSQEGLAVVIVNPGIILGAGFWQQGTGALFTKIEKGFSYYTEGVNAFVGVEDVVKAMLQLTQSAIKNERFILVSENRSFKEVFFKIADGFGKKRPSKKITATVLNVVWRLDWLKTFIIRSPRKISKYSATSLVGKSKYSSKKIAQRLAFRFAPIEKVIKKTCLNYLEGK